MKYRIASLSLICALSAAPVLAEQPSFSYVDTGYRSQEDFSGLDVHASFAVAKYIYLAASYAYLSDSENTYYYGDVDYDVSLAEIGIGFKLAIGDSTSLYLQVDGVRADSKSSYAGTSESDDEGGHRETFGVRTMLSDSFELYGDISHLELQESFTEVTFGLKGYFTKHVGLFAEVYRNDSEADGHTIGLSVRF